MVLFVVVFRVLFVSWVSVDVLLCVFAVRSPFSKNCQKDANKKKATHTIENDERTANTNKNPNGNSGRKENTNDDDKENQDINKSEKRTKNKFIILEFFNFYIFSRG